jgi:1-deoxy-D-xylulose-5-phosphate reductoisomerase
MVCAIPEAIGRFLLYSAAATEEQSRCGRSKSRRVVVLGSTGSVGTNALEVVECCSDRLEIIGLSANTNWRTLFQQACRVRPRWVAITDPRAARQADVSLLPPCTEFLSGGQESIARMVADVDTDVVVSAIVGAAGLHGTWAALDAGKTVALANKETLVVAGSRVKELEARRRGRILPVDSEHSAIFQAIAGAGQALVLSIPEVVERIVLTGSGGPFRGKVRSDLRNVQTKDALNHPTWKMGPKITIDSATLMNKALEVIEARWLFDLPPERIDVIVHPESIVHSFVEFRDGSILAQLSPPDMRLPIQYALNYPDRVVGPAHRLDWNALQSLHFEPPDRATFTALDLGYEVARAGGTSGAVLNAANEAAVGMFLDGRLAFLDITRVCKAVLQEHDWSPNPSLEELMAADRWARQEVSRWTRLPHPTPTP